MSEIHQLLVSHSEEPQQVLILQDQTELQPHQVLEVNEALAASEGHIYYVDDNLGTSEATQALQVDMAATSVPEIAGNTSSGEVLLFDKDTGEYHPCILAAAAEQESGYAVVMPEEPSTQNTEEVYEEQVIDENLLLECSECSKTFLSQDLKKHFDEFHHSPKSEKIAGGVMKSCVVCSKSIRKNEYLEHFKEVHADVRLGCPKCPQTYHSPELLNVHYKYLHMKDETKKSKSNEEANVVEEVRLHDHCDLCNQVVTSLEEHLTKVHQIIEMVEVAPEKKFRNTTTSKALGCEICEKSFQTQREFANHRRRKGFCKPPQIMTSPPKRRIGIIRKTY